MSIVTIPPAAAQLSLFDYDALPVESRQWAKDTTSQIKQEITQLAGLVRQTAWSVWRLGRGLAEMQEKLTPLGQFSAWVEAEVPTLSRATAYNAIKAYKAFPSGLPSVDGAALEMPLKALYLLASPDAEPIREQVITQAITTGTPITTEAVKQAVAERGAEMEIIWTANPSWPVSIQKAYGEIVAEWGRVVCAFAFAQPYHVQQAKRLSERLRAIMDRHEPDHLGSASRAKGLIDRWTDAAEGSLFVRAKAEAAKAAPTVEVEAALVARKPSPAPVAAAASTPTVITETSVPEWRTVGERLAIECDADVREAAFALEVASDLAIVLSAGVDHLIEGGKLHPALEAALVAALGGDAEAALGDVLAERLMEADGRANQFEAAAELLAAIVEVA
jgi:hypothetical protein